MMDSGTCETAKMPRNLRAAPTTPLEASGKAKASWKLVTQ